MSATLIIGREDDLCCRMVRDRLEALGREALYLPEDQLFPGLRFVWELRNGKSRGSVGFAERNARFHQIDGVLARFSGITTTPEEHRTKDGQYLNSEWHALARGYVHRMPCPVVNRLRPELWYKSRLSIPDMISLIPGIKFRLPKMMMTTKFEDACSFFNLCGGRMRYTPLSMLANYVIETREDLEKLEPLSKVLPLHLTEIISGEGRPAFVVGEEAVFDGPFDAAAARCCTEAAAGLGLTFCEFELIKTPGGEWYCYAIHCAPYLFTCGDEARAAITEKLVTILSAKSQRRAA